MTDRIQISLAAARVNAKMTQEDVAKMLKVTKNTVVSWEKGESEPKFSQAFAMSDAFKMPLENIFFINKSHFK